MKWILIGQLLGSMVLSEHDTREACEGRLTILREKTVVGKCVAPAHTSGALQFVTPGGRSVNTTGALQFDTPGGGLIMVPNVGANP